MTDPTRPSRRAVLTRASALGALSTLPVLSAFSAVPAPAQPSRPDPSAEVRLAFLTDTHTDPENPVHQANLEAVLSAIEGTDPDLVIHGGDVTEHGAVAEYEAFEEAVPDALRDILVAVPGNHESRWDATGGARPAAELGAPVRTVDVAGIRVILADTTTFQQEIAWWSDEVLEQLDQELRTAGDRPRILVSHFPMGEGFYYVRNQGDFDDVVARHPVALHLTGHTHRELLSRVNRRDQLEGAAVKDEPVYYELTGDGGQLDVVRATVVDLEDPSQVERTAVVTLELSALTKRDRLSPRRVDISDRGEQVEVGVHVPGAKGATVDVVHYDVSHLAGRNEELEWISLSENRPGRFAGTIGAADLADGPHRLHVRVTPADDSGSRLVTEEFERGDFAPAWTVDLGGVLQAAPAVIEDAKGSELLVVGTPAGELVALDGSGERAWSTEMTGPVRNDVVTRHDGGSVVVVDTAGAMRALDSSGATLWELTHEAPFAADPAVVRLGEREAVVAASDMTLIAVDAETGELLWSRDMGTPAMGAPASDGERVVVGGGDGSAHAFDAADGSPLWSRSVTDKKGTYQRLIYGPWNDSVTILPDGGVLISTVADARCLEPLDGGQRWYLEGSYLYPRKQLWDGLLVIADDPGDIVLVDPSDGTEQARHETGERIMDEGFVLAGDVAYACSHAGLLSAVDLRSGDVRQIARLASSAFVAPGAAFEDLVVFTDFSGTLHAIGQI